MADIAQLGFEIDSTQARTAARDLDKLAASADKTERSAKKLSDASRDLLRDEKGRFISAADSAAKYGAEIDALRTKYNPLYAASKQFESAQSDIKRALELGAISVSQADAALERLNAQMISTSSGGMSKFNMQSANVFAQLNDIGVMMASGQNPLIVAIQQGTQLNQVWADMGSRGRTLSGVASVLGQAFTSMISPMSLLTIGVIAGGAALVQWGMSALGAADNAKTFDERIDGILSGISEINELNKFSETSGIEAMGDAYGVVSQEVRSLIEAQRQLANDSAAADLADTIKEISEATGTSWSQMLFVNKAVGVTVPDAIIEAENRVENLRNSLKLTQNDAKSLGAAMEVAFSAKTVNEQVSGLQKVREYLTIIANSGREGADEAKKMLDQIVKAEDAARKLSAASDGLPSKFNAAASAASKITDELNRAASAAAMIASSAVSDVRFAQIELDFRTDPVAKAAALAAARFDAEVGNSGMDQGLFNRMRKQAIAGAEEAARIQAEVERLNDIDREKNKKKGGGGTAAVENDFEQLKISLEKSSQFQIEKYEKDLGVLKDALSKRLATQDEYYSLEQMLRTQYFGSEFEQSQLQREIEQSALEAALEQKYITQEQYNQRLADLRSQEMSSTLGHYSTLFGNMADIAKAGGDKTTGIVKAFSIAQGLINSYLAYTEVLADPSLVGHPFLRKALAASTLAAGLAQVANMKSGGGGSSGSAASSATSASSQEPIRTTRVELIGDDWMTALVRDKIAPALYEATKDGGRVQFV